MYYYEDEAVRVWCPENDSFAKNKSPAAPIPHKWTEFP